MTTLAKNLPLDQIGKAPIRQTCSIEVIKKTKTGGVIRVSTSSYDRENDRVFPRGGQLKNYLDNPVVQWGHLYDLPWQTIGRTTVIDVQDGWVDVDFELRPAANEHDPQHIVILLWEGGWIKTASIGFKPLKVKGNERGGYDFVEWELLEWSLVPIPANQEALRLAAKAFDGQETHTLMHKELSLDSLVEAVFRALYRALYTDAYWDSHERIDQCPVAVYATYGIVRIGLDHYRVEYSIEDGQIKLQERDQWTLVEQVWADGENAFAKHLLSQLVTTDTHQKAGARHSKADSAAVQAIHDYAVALGATCEEAATDSEDEAAEKAAPTIEVKETEPEPEQDVTALLAALRKFNGAARPTA